jgi:hypothetical protein
MSKKNGLPYMSLGTGGVYSVWTKGERKQRRQLGMVEARDNYDREGRWEATRDGELVGRYDLLKDAAEHLWESRDKELDGVLPRIGDWQCTFSGVAFYPLDPRPDEILLVDIAHALSNMCRFAGHVQEFYSVAEHSVHVSRRAMELWGAREGQTLAGLAGLLHDGSEAYLVDVPRPMKRHALMEPYRKAEESLQYHIYQRFGVVMTSALEDVVHDADDEMLATERMDLMPYFKSDGSPSRKWSGLRTPLEHLRITHPLLPAESEQLFLNHFHYLQGAFDATRTG